MRNESNEHAITAESGVSATPNTCESTTESEERWLPIPGFEGRYEVSDMGRVRSLTKYSRVLRTLDTGRGYRQVTLVDIGGKKHQKSVHCLVLLAFVGPRPEGLVACHNDGVKGNNRINNLRWDTVASNAADKKIHGTVFRASGSKHVLSKLKEEAVLEIRKRLDAGETQRKLASLYGVSQPVISRIKTRQSWSHL